MTLYSYITSAPTETSTDAAALFAETILLIQVSEEGWDYTLYDLTLKEIDGGQLDTDAMNILDAIQHSSEEFGLTGKQRFLDCEEILYMTEDGGLD